MRESVGVLFQLHELQGERPNEVNGIELFTLDVILPVPSRGCDSD
jgi:hypothetical protein